ncbi:MAG: hypothetical protein KC636_32610 [Myxococcales bacterium]|nr:hypothetical protein [Myxococcales bacterium]
MPPLIAGLLACALGIAPIHEADLDTFADAPEAAAAPYDEAQARADLEVVLAKVGREYLEARARLEAHPEVSAPLLLERLEAVPAPGPAARNRLLAVLGAFRRPEDAAIIARQIRAMAVAGADAAVIENWRAVLRELGPSALEAISSLVADKDLEEPLRANLLADLVVVYPIDRIDELLALVGLGEPTIRRELAHALARRARAEAGELATMATAIDARMVRADLDRHNFAALAQLRARISPADDPAVHDVLAGLIARGELPFIVRAAAILALGDRPQPSGDQVFVSLVEDHLRPGAREQQESELLGWLALTALDPQRAAAPIARLDLLRAESPRVAAAAYGKSQAPTAPDARLTWVATSQQHAWPEVRVAALDRLQGPCDRALERRLTDIADLSRRQGDEEVTVARAALAALGRCGGDAARAQLTKILNKHKLDQDRRSEAGRQLVKHHGAIGADEVAAALDREADYAVSLRLIRALRLRPTAATPRVYTALCEAAATPELASEVRSSLEALFTGAQRRCP